MPRQADLKAKAPATHDQLVVSENDGSGEAGEAPLLGPLEEPRVGFAPLPSKAQGRGAKQAGGRAAAAAGAAASAASVPSASTTRTEGKRRDLLSRRASLSLAGMWVTCCVLCEFVVVDWEWCEGLALRV